MDDYFWIHVVIALLLAAWFLYLYLKKDHYTYQLIFVFWLPTTLLTYISQNTVYRSILAGVQLVLFLLVLYYMFKNPPGKERNQEEKAGKRTFEENNK